MISLIIPAATVTFTPTAGGSPWRAAGQFDIRIETHTEAAYSRAGEWLGEYYLDQTWRVTCTLDAWDDPAPLITSTAALGGLGAWRLNGELAFGPAHNNEQFRPAFVFAVFETPHFTGPKSCPRLVIEFTSVHPILPPQAAEPKAPMTLDALRALLGGGTDGAATFDAEGGFRERPPSEN